MGTLDSRRIQEASIVTDQDSTREGEFGQGLQAAGGEGAGAIGDALAAFEEFAEFGMCLETLEFFIG